MTHLLTSTLPCSNLLVSSQLRLMMEHSRGNQEWHQLPGQQHPPLPASKNCLGANISDVWALLQVSTVVQFSVISYLSKGCAPIQRQCPSASNVLASTETLKWTTSLTASKHPLQEWATLLAQLPLGAFLDKKYLWGKRKKNNSVLTWGSQPFPLNVHVFESTDSKYSQKMKCGQQQHWSNSLHRSGMSHSPEN